MERDGRHNDLLSVQAVDYIIYILGTDERVAHGDLESELLRDPFPLLGFMLPCIWSHLLLFVALRLEINNCTRQIILIA